MSLVSGHTGDLQGLSRICQASVCFNSLGVFLTSPLIARKTLGGAHRASLDALGVQTLLWDCHCQVAAAGDLSP